MARDDESWGGGDKEMRDVASIYLVVLLRHPRVQMETKRGSKETTRLKIHSEIESASSFSLRLQLKFLINIISEQLLLLLYFFYSSLRALTRLKHVKKEREKRTFNLLYSKLLNERF